MCANRHFITFTQERRLASQLGYDDPVNATFDATTDMYYAVSELLLREMSTTASGERQRKLHVIFASHNDDTIRWLLRK